MVGDAMAVAEEVSVVLFLLKAFFQAQELTLILFARSQG
jgi:hypothetical protein